MRLVFWKNKKIDSDNVLASCNNSKWCSALRYYCPNVSQLVCNQRKRDTRCSQVVGWLVWMGLMSAFQIRCKFLEKQILSLFVGIFAGVNECSFSKFMSFWVGFLAFLWPKVMKNHGVLKFVSFWVGFLAFLWPKVTKNHGIPEICVILHPETLKFHVVGELSCWGHKLEIEC